MVGTLGAHEKVQVVLSFDDFPMGKTALYGQKERVERYLEKLKAAGVKTAFFCIGSQSATKVGRECIALADQNHCLANHSYHHLHLSEIPLTALKQEILDTEKLLSSCQNYHKWFRFPYLDYGNREALGGNEYKRALAFKLLKNMGYSHGYVSLNTFDWYLDHQLQKAVAKGVEIDWQQLKSAYLSLLNEWIDGYHAIWQQSYTKEFVHVLLFHQNDLNLLYLEDIIGMIEEKGWEIVTPESAFDPQTYELARFVSVKGGMSTTPPSLSLKHIDQVIADYQLFRE